MKNKNKKTYLKNCKHLFPISGKAEREYLKSLEFHLDEFLDEIPDASYKEIEEQFGSPTSVITSYYENVDEANLLKRTNLSKYIRLSLATIVLTFAVFLGYRGVVIYQAYLDAKDTLIIHESTTITYSEADDEENENTINEKKENVTVTDKENIKE